MSEASATLPPGWCWYRLGDLAEIKSGLAKGKRRGASDAVRQVPYLRVANVQRGFLDLSEVKSIEATEAEIAGLLLQPGDVLFNEGGDRDKLGRGWIWSGEIGECIHQNHVFRARLLPEIEPRFISFYGNSAAQDYFLRSGKQTTNLASINREQLASLPIPTPPAAEQRRIVARVDRLSARVSEARATLDEVPELLKLHRQSVLAAAFRGDLTADGRASHPDAEPAAVLLDRIRQERRHRWEAAELARMKSPPRDDRWKAKYQEPEVVDESDLPELPEAWCWASLEELTSAVSTICYGVIQPGDEVTDGIPLVRVCDLYDGRVKQEQLRTISPDVDQEYTRTRLTGGEVLVSVVGTIGRIAVVPSSLAGANIARALARLSPIPAIEPGWLAAWLNTTAMQTWLHSESREVARKTLNIKELERCVVPLAPVPEMEQVLARLRDAKLRIDVVQSQVASALGELEIFDQAILAKAFRGELVPQDLDDEPASALLDRIRAERQAEGKGRSARSRQRKLTGLD